MKNRGLEVVRLLASPSCESVLACLQEGLNHPDDISKKLGVVRQSVDWHLLKLSALGIIEREAVSSLGSRPRIIYKLTPDGKELMRSIDGAVNEHFQKIMKKIEKLEHDLDVMLAKGDISEEAYTQRVQRLIKEKDILEGR